MAKERPTLLTIYRVLGTAERDVVVQHLNARLRSAMPRFDRFLVGEYLRNLKPSDVALFDEAKNAVLAGTRLRRTRAR